MPTENMDSYVTRLRSLAKSCEYYNVDEMIRDQVVDKCASNSLRRRLLRETDLTLDGLLQIARSVEASDLHAAKMEEASDTSRQVNKICSGSQRSNDKMRESSRSRAPNHDKKPVVCFCCGCLGHRAKDSSCPAVGKTCSNCGKKGHFEGVCKSAPKRVTDSPNIAYQRNANGLRYVTVEDNTDSDDEYLFAIGSNMEDNAVQITVEGTLIPPGDLVT